MRRYARAAVRRLCGGPLTELSAMFWWLWASTLASRVANFVVSFSVLYLTTERALSASVAGLLIGFYGLGSVVGSLLGGVAADRNGAKRTLVVGSFGAAFATLLLGLTHGALILTAMIFLVGLFGGVTRPATSALVVELVPAKSRVRVFALNYWAMNLGFAVACVCAGFATVAGYTTLFLIDGASTLACALMVCFLVQSPTARSRRVPGAKRGVAWSKRIAIYLLPLHNGLFAAAVAMSVVTTALLQQLTATLPLAMRASGHSPATYGIVAALNGVLVCGLQIPLSSLLSRKPLVLSLSAGALLMGIGFGLTAVVHGVMGYAATLAIWTIGEIVAAPALPALVSELAPEGEGGNYQGMLNAAWSLGAILGPVLGTAAFASWSGHGLWLACGIAGFVVAGGYGAMNRPLEDRLADSEARVVITA
jgi:MFS family permease